MNSFTFPIFFCFCSEIQSNSDVLCSTTVAQFTYDITHGTYDIALRTLRTHAAHTPPPKSCFPKRERAPVFGGELHMVDPVSKVSWFQQPFSNRKSTRTPHHILPLSHVSPLSLETYYKLWFYHNTIPYRITHVCIVTYHIFIYG